ncbi:Down syndrome cell adhesion molecule [Chionoecetes opilio]|uniref:Down syndrome cell adhesion molecule n=1 Tax=Chionoecetes opilio TaxID=41210 RepID=A0A8J4Y3K3_CHIOP|nr:Down syndrome cell adhesion molecule [Chionoecetes opilio]
MPLGLYGVFGERTVIKDEQTEFVNMYENVTLACLHSEGETFWKKEGKAELGVEVLSNGSLFISNVTDAKSGYYACISEQDDHVIALVRLVVGVPPDPPENVTVRALTIFVVVTWHLHLDPGWEQDPSGPRTTFHLQYRPEDSPAWRHPPAHISPTQGQVDVCNLTPNTTYEFQLWTSNRFGNSETVSFIATTLPQFSEMEQAERLEGLLQDFNPLVWVVAVVIAMVATNVLGGLLLLAYYFQHRVKRSGDSEDAEKIELVPHIIENPGYHVDGSHSLETIHESLLSSPTNCQAAAVL